MTGPQRTRLVLALGALNIVLATVAFGLAGSLDTTDQVARATATPSLSAPPVADGSPAPSTEPGGTQPPATTPTEAPGEPPEASAPPATVTPGSSTPGAVAVATTPAPAANPATPTGPAAPPPAATPAGPAAATPAATPAPPPAATPAAPPTAAPPTAAPVVVPPPSPPPSKATPPCPGTVSGAPGLSKGAGDPTRPCKGGEGDGKGGSADDRARGDEQARSRANPCRGRRRREVA